LLARAVLSVNREIRQRRAFVIVHRSFVIARKSPNVHWSLIDFSAGNDKRQMNDEQRTMDVSVHFVIS